MGARGLMGMRTDNGWGTVEEQGAVKHVCFITPWEELASGRNARIAGSGNEIDLHGEFSAWGEG
jgi:hypothetical protein